MPYVPGADVGERFAFEIFPEGLALSQDCPNPLICSLLLSLDVNFADISISLFYTLCMAGRYGVFVRGMVHGFVPQVWGLVPSEHVSSLPTAYQAPGIVGRPYN